MKTTIKNFVFASLIACLMSAFVSAPCWASGFQSIEAMETHNTTIQQPGVPSPSTLDFNVMLLGTSATSLTSVSVFHRAPVFSAACGDPVNTYADCLAECHCDQDRCPYGSLRCQGNFNYCKAECVDWFIGPDGRF